MTKEQAELFRIGRRKGWPKIVCARYAGMKKMPGSRTRTGNVKGMHLDDIFDKDYLPMAKILADKQKKLWQMKQDELVSKYKL